MPAGRTVRLDSNQPFEFQEALLSAAERNRLARASSARQLFAGEPQRPTAQEFRLRAISIRLRTINNACDSGASLPDGIPLTEVSIYGSRDRHYVMGPYRAIQRLMGGELPDHRPYKMNDVPGSAAARQLETAQVALGEYITQVKKGDRVQRIHLDSLLPRGPVAGKFGRMVQLAPEDLGSLRKASARLGALKLDIPQAPEPPAPPHHWWEEMPQFNAQDEYERLIDDIMGKAREVLCELEDQVFAPG